MSGSDAVQIKEHKIINLNKEKVESSLTKNNKQKIKPI